MSTASEIGELDSRIEENSTTMALSRPVSSLQTATDQIQGSDNVLNMALTNGASLDSSLWKKLPEEVVELIIARLSFTDFLSFMQSEGLARRWRELFYSISFQAEVSSASFRWASYFPFFIDPLERRNHPLPPSTVAAIVGYDRAVGEDVEIGFMQDIDNRRFQNRIMDIYPTGYPWGANVCDIAGSLISFSTYESVDQNLYILITNPINKSVRYLPPLNLGESLCLLFNERKGRLSRVPHAMDNIQSEPYRVLLTSDNPFAYKAFVSFRDRVQEKVHVQIFHPNLNCWSELEGQPADLPTAFGLNSSVYLRQVLYLCFMKDIDIDRLTLHLCLAEYMLIYAYGLGEGIQTFRLLPLTGVQDMQILDCKLLVCQDHLLLIVRKGSYQEVELDSDEEENDTESEEEDEEDKAEEDEIDEEEYEEEEEEEEEDEEEDEEDEAEEDKIHQEEDTEHDKEEDEEGEDREDEENQEEFEYEWEREDEHEQEQPEHEELWTQCIPKDGIVIYRVDLDLETKCGQLKEIARGPPNRVNRWTVTGLVVSDTDCIHLQTVHSKRQPGQFETKGALVFDARNHKWTAPGSGFEYMDMTLTDYVYQPGLNPFVVA